VDGKDRPRITDFGVAQRLGTRPNLNGNGQILGSPSYMPPEKVLANRKLGRRTDVYGLGAILYHLLTGQPPFSDERLEHLFRLVLKAEPVPLRKLNRAVPSSLEIICLRCLEKESCLRCATAKDLAEQLELIEPK
jgi:serine/threonine-protein kinase